MWPSSSIDLENVNIVLDQRIIQNKSVFEPTPYTFTKIENGKKTTADSTSLTPPSWLLIDHTIAVVWMMFSLNPTQQQLSIEDLKWTYEFLKRIKNRKGENPPDVKVCLKEIQDRLINLYAKLTALKEEDFEEIAAAFGNEIAESSTENYLTNSQENESKLNGLSLTPAFSFAEKNSFKDLVKSANKTAFPLLEEDSDLCDVSEAGEEEEIEKYFLSLFEGERKEEPLQAKPSTKSLIPTKKKPSSAVLPEVSSSSDSPRKEKTSKRVHCYAEMRSVKFKKSMKVKDTNGEDAAYSNLKAEIKRLTINPNVSKKDVWKFLQDWKSEQTDRLQNEVKRLTSIERFIKSLYQEDAEHSLRVDSQLNLKGLETEISNYSWRKSLFS